MPKANKEKDTSSTFNSNMGINLMVSLSQQEFPLAKKETMKEEELSPGTKVAQEGGISQTNMQEKE
jgi:hypothetical protein